MGSVYVQPGAAVTDNPGVVTSGPPGITCFLIVDPEHTDEWRRADPQTPKEAEERHSNPEEFGPGAMWEADWMGGWEKDGVKYWGVWENQTSPPLIVLTPGGEWNIDSRAGNCKLPDDRLHRCWVRHGTPPNITVDTIGQTCGAGAGSIMAGRYHGFLRNGVLVPA